MVQARLHCLSTPLSAKDPDTPPAPAVIDIEPVCA